jgi:hypothetical protein
MGQAALSPGWVSMIRSMILASPEPRSGPIQRKADPIDGYDRDDLGERPDY